MMLQICGCIAVWLTIALADFAWRRRALELVEPEIRRMQARFRRETGFEPPPYVPDPVWYSAACAAAWPVMMPVEAFRTMGVESRFAKRGASKKEEDE